MPIASNSPSSVDSRPKYEPGPGLDAGVGRIGQPSPLLREKVHGRAQPGPGRRLHALRAFLGGGGDPGNGVRGGHRGHRNSQPSCRRGRARRDRDLLPRLRLRPGPLPPPPPWGRDGRRLRSDRGRREGHPGVRPRRRPRGDSRGTDDRRPRPAPPRGSLPDRRRPVRPDPGRRPVGGGGRGGPDPRGPAHLRRPGPPEGPRPRGALERGDGPPPSSRRERRAAGPRRVGPPNLGRVAPEHRLRPLPPTSGPGVRPAIRPRTLLRSRRPVRRPLRERLHPRLRGDRPGRHRRALPEGGRGGPPPGVRARVRAPLRLTPRPAAAKVRLGGRAARERVLPAAESESEEDPPDGEETQCGGDGPRSDPELRERVADGGRDHVPRPDDERVEEVLRRVLLLPRDDGEEHLARRPRDPVLRPPPEGLDPDEQGGGGPEGEGQAARRGEGREDREGGPHSDAGQQAAREQEPERGREEVHEEVDAREEGRPGTAIGEGGRRDPGLLEVDEGRPDGRREGEEPDPEEIAGGGEEPDPGEEIAARGTAGSPFGGSAPRRRATSLLPFEAEEADEPMDAQDADLEHRGREEEEERRIDGSGQRGGEGRPCDRSERPPGRDEGEEALPLPAPEEVGHEPPEDRHDEHVEDAQPDEEGASRPGGRPPGGGGEEEVEHHEVRREEVVDRGEELASGEAGDDGGEEGVRDEGSAEGPEEEGGEMAPVLRPEGVAHGPQQVVAGEKEEEVGGGPEEPPDLGGLDRDDSPEQGVGGEGPRSAPPGLSHPFFAPIFSCQARRTSASRSGEIPPRSFAWRSSGWLFHQARVSYAVSSTGR